MGNGCITVALASGDEARYELGDIALFSEGDGYQAVGGYEITGNIEAPICAIEGSINRPGCKFNFGATFEYDPKKGPGGGFRFKGGWISHPERKNIPLRSVMEFTEILTSSRP
jgi:hypothetical protein